MNMQYITDINETDKNRVLLLIDASIQAYNIFDVMSPDQPQKQKIISPAGYDFIDSWSGVDSIYSEHNLVECYGVIFRS